MVETTNSTSTTLRVEKALHVRLKLLAVRSGKTLEALVDELLRPAVARLERNDA